MHVYNISCFQMYTVRIRYKQLQHVFTEHTISFILIRLCIQKMQLIFIDIYLTMAVTVTGQYQYI